MGIENSESGTPSSRGCLVNFIIVFVILVGIVGAFLSFGGNAQRFTNFIYHRIFGHQPWKFSEWDWSDHSQKCTMLYWDVPPVYVDVLMEALDKKFDIYVMPIHCSGSPFQLQNHLICDFYFINSSHEKEVRRDQKKWLSMFKGKIPFVPLIIYGEWPEVSKEEALRIVEKALEGKTIQREKWSDDKPRKNGLVFFWGVPDVYGEALGQQMRAARSFNFPRQIDPGYAISMLASGRADLFCVNNRYREEMRNKHPYFEKFNRVIYDDWPLVSKKEALKKTKKLIRKFKIPQKKS